MQTATQEAVGSIKMISSTIGKISESTSAISAAIEEQGAATQEISGNIQRTAAGTTPGRRHCRRSQPGRQPDRRGIGSIVVVGKAIVAYHRQPAGRDRRFPQVDCDGGLTAFSEVPRRRETVRPAPTPAGP
jgi:hypothetical protein